MAHNTRLDNILRALHRPSTNLSELSRLHATSAAVLVSLTNPLNVTLLTTQILTSPAIWSAPPPTSDLLRSALGVYGSFVSATLGKIESLDIGLGIEEWLESLVRGANANVPRWKHLLVMGGVLVAFRQKGFLPRNTRRSLEEAFVRATNLSIVGDDAASTSEADVVSLICARVVPGLTSPAKHLLDHDSLARVLVRSIYYSPEGFQSGYFLSKIDHDVMARETVLTWPAQSNSFLELQARAARPLFTSMTSLARLLSTEVVSSAKVATVDHFLEKMLEFTGTLDAQWRMNKLSEVGAWEEEDRIDAESRKFTMPVVWQMLKTILFTTTLVLHELINKVVGSRELSRPQYAGTIAMKTLLIFRNLYFITSRMGHNAFSTYIFTYLCSLDLLTSHPDCLLPFLSHILPRTAGLMPSSYMDRTTDLYFLNTTEHLVLTLPADKLDIILTSLTPYLSPPPNPGLHAHFESAHTLLLALLSAPSTPLETNSRLVPFYTDAVLHAFPAHLTSRQFLLAITTLARATSPPNALAETDMVRVLLELLAERASEASPAGAADAVKHAPDEMALNGLPPRAIFLVGLIKSLPHVEISILRPWLEALPGLVNALSVEEGRDRVREIVWETLAGEMDVERAEVAVRWWCEEGGREGVMGVEREALTLEEKVDARI